MCLECRSPKAMSKKGRKNRANKKASRWYKCKTLTGHSYHRHRHRHRHCHCQRRRHRRHLKLIFIHIFLFSIKIARGVCVLMRCQIISGWAYPFCYQPSDASRSYSNKLMRQMDKSQYTRTHCVCRLVCVFGRLLPCYFTWSEQEHHWGLDAPIEMADGRDRDRATNSWHQYHGRKIKRMWLYLNTKHTHTHWYIFQPLILCFIQCFQFLFLPTATTSSSFLVRSFFFILSTKRIFSPYNIYIICIICVCTRRLYIKMLK